MELREFVGIFIQSKRILLWMFILFSAGGIILFRIQPPRFEAALVVNVTRESPSETSDFRYDQFYRLQADERFADTVVRWLAAPSVRRDIAERAGEGSSDVVDTIAGKRLSSQMIDVRYDAGEPSDLDGIDRAIADSVNALACDLNRDAREQGWFAVSATRPVVSDARIPLWKTVIGGSALGLFLGFWIVLIRWYWKR